MSGLLPVAPPRWRTWPLITLSITLTAVVGFLGSIAGPTWDPSPVGTPVVMESDGTGITDGEGQPVGRPPQGTYDVLRHNLEIDLGPVTVPAWLFEPDGAPEGPGVVFIHGAGTVGPQAFAQQVHALTSAGIRTLVPAKRTDTYSTRQRDYVAMAHDYLKSWAELRELPGVDPDQVGLYGESEGAWIAPVAGVEEPGVAFIMLASAPVVSPREQAAYATANYLRGTNAPRGLFRAIPRALGAKIPGGGFDYIDFDVLPFYEQLHQPVLMLYGTGDASMPTVQGARLTQERLARGGNTAFTTRYFEGADHGLKTGEELAPAVTSVITDWVWGLPETAHPREVYAGATPEQPFLAEPVPEPRWYASGDFLVYSAIAAFGLSFAGVLLSAWSARRRREWGPVVRYSIATVLAAYAAIAVFLGYVGQVANLATSYQLNDPLVLGGWVLVYLGGIFASLIAVMSIRGSYLAGKNRRTLSAPTRTGVWLCHLGALAMLLIAAYWGVFPAVG